MAHILFLTPYYPPEKGAAMVRISETAKRLVLLGHQVTVLTTFPNYPTGMVSPEYHVQLIQKEFCDGVRVIRIWSYFTPHKGFIRRIFAQISFGCLAPLLGAKAVGQPDIIIVQSPPIFDAIAGRLLARMKRCPFVFMVSDLWPESAIQLDAIRNPLLIRLATWLVQSTYRKANLVWALSDGIRRAIIEQGIPAKKVFLLTNGADITHFHELPKECARADLNWDERFTVLYAGTHGLSHGLGTILAAAECMQDDPEVHFIFVGDGSEKAELVALAHRRNLKNVTFLASVPYEQMPLVFAAADICLVPMRKIPLFEGRLPLKMFEIMAAGRPILLGVDGEARKIAEKEANAAIYVEPENVSLLISGILSLKRHPEEAEKLGRQGRAYIETRFDRDQLTMELDARLAPLLDKPIASPLSEISPMELFWRRGIKNSAGRR